MPLSIVKLHSTFQIEVVSNWVYWEKVVIIKRLWYRKHTKKTLDAPGLKSIEIIQWTLVTANAWIVNNLSLVNIFGETGRLFYNINYMLNSKYLSLVNKIGDRTEFTITRVHCTFIHNDFLLRDTNGLKRASWIVFYRIF